ncbi:IS701 family transposase [Streptomyces sp. NPDC058623]|uniref:IS701 family transposase n=1 Tax=Streptomyces sp. NPDC058623 TaxID=3346563 RepID=UPI0036474AEF
MIQELSPRLFSHLPRQDQRGKGVTYLRGLLTAPGRKSIRNIATFDGADVSAQALHHFICHSTWDWDSFRRRLTRHVVDTVPPEAWVIAPMVFPKAGEHSVGVERAFAPTAGRLLNAQRVVSVWAASDALAAPVNWRLLLPHTWLADDERRFRSSIPEELECERWDECIVNAYRAVPRRGELPVLPVVLDARDLPVLEISRALRELGAPVLLRVNGMLQLEANDASLPGPGQSQATAQRIMTAAAQLRRPTTRSVSTATVRVTTTTGTEMDLLGVWYNGDSWPAELWVTDHVTASAAELVRLTRLIDRVEKCATTIAHAVGMRDYSGRTFGGWHRHMSLVSAAHIIRAMS